MNQRAVVALIVGVLGVAGALLLLTGDPPVSGETRGQDVAPPLDQRAEDLGAARVNPEKIRKAKVALREAADGRRLLPGLEPVRMRPPPPPGLTAPGAEGEEEEAEPGVFPMDPEGIKAAIGERTPDLKACYETALFHTPGLEGVLTLVLEVAPAEGEPHARVSKVDVESDLDAVVLEGCIATVFEELRFDTDTATTLRYPVHFREQ